MSRRIGSVFPAEEQSCDVPVRDVAGAVLAQSGGQALRLVSESLWPGPGATLLFPAYFCETMLHPFGSRDWNILFYPLGERLLPDWDALESRLPDERACVLLPEYFGNRLRDGERARVRAWQRAGVRVVEDWTHSHLGPERAPVDVAIASLRKMLPVGDGGQVWGLTSTPDLPLRPGPGDTLWEAMDALRTARDEHDRSEAMAEVGAAEERFARQLTPAAISGRSRAVIASLDLAEMARRRRTNAVALRDMIADDVVVNRLDDGDVPSHLVIEVTDARRLQGQLAEHGVFCPVHWPRPAGAPDDPRWGGLLSVPVDHRYDVDDMAHVAETWRRIRG